MTENLPTNQDAEDLVEVDPDWLQSMRMRIRAALDELDAVQAGQPVTVPGLLEVHPTGRPAAVLPDALLMDVCDVLEVHGLRVKEVPDGLGLVAVTTALVRVLDAVPAEYGGSATS